MTRNRCTALCAALHSKTDRGRDLNREQTSKRGRWSAREVEIRDGIKHCETERVNETEEEEKKPRQEAVCAEEIVAE